LHHSNVISTTHNEQGDARYPAGVRGTLEGPDEPGLIREANTLTTTYNSQSKTMLVMSEDS
jgi:hypothetical protein